MGRFEWTKGDCSAGFSAAFVSAARALAKQLYVEPRRATLFATGCCAILIGCKRTAHGEVDARGSAVVVNSMGFAFVIEVLFASSANQGTVDGTLDAVNYNCRAFRRVEVCVENQVLAAMFFVVDNFMDSPTAL